MNARTDYRSQLQAGRWFQGLPEALQTHLLALAQPRQLPPGQRLFARGDAPCGLYCVVEGAIRISAVSEHGKEALLILVEPPHWFGEIALFDGQARTTTPTPKVPPNCCRCRRRHCSSCSGASRATGATWPC